MFIDDLPTARGIWVSRHALKHKGNTAVAQRTIKNIAVTSNPAHIGGTPKDITLVVIKGIFKAHGHHQQITTSGMHHTFGFTGRT